MNKLILGIELILLILALAGSTAAQDYQMIGRFSLGVNIGFYSGSNYASSTAYNGYKTNISSNLFFGGISVSHWAQEDLAIKFSAGMMTGSETISITSNNQVQDVSAVIPILIGINYYLPEPLSANRIRTFISGSIGTYTGHEIKNNILLLRVNSETVMGARAGAGVDYILFKHALLGANLGYNAMNDFSHPIGGKNNYNGGDFSLQFDYLF